jgi:hypothetical protein
MVAIIDRSTPLTDKGERPSLQFQVLWSSLRRELAQLQDEIGDCCDGAGGGSSLELDGGDAMGSDGSIEIDGGGA